MSRPIKHDGVVFRREGSKFWWIRYRDRAGKRQRESTFTEDWQEAQKILRDAASGQGWQRFAGGS